MITDHKFVYRVSSAGCCLHSDQEVCSLAYQVLSVGLLVRRVLWKRYEGAYGLME